MAEPRGLFNRSSSGLGTILGPKGKDFFDYQLAGQEQKRREAAAKKAAADKKQADLDKAALKLLESKDTYAIYQDAADQELQRGIDLYASGNATQADLMRIAANYASLINKGNQLQKVDEAAFDAAKENKRINEAEWTKIRNERLLADQSLQALQGRTVDPETGMVFYRDMVGGSAALNEQAVVTDVVAKLGEDITSFMQGGDVEWLRGNRITKNQQTNEKVKKAFQYDAATGSYRVKSADDLMDLGITDAFMKDGDMKRIVMDKIFNTMTEDEWDALSTDERNRRISETVAETLKPYAGGEMKVEDKTRSDRYQTKTESERKGDEEEARRREWYQHLKSGNKTLMKNALDFLAQDDAQISGATLQRISDPELRFQGREGMGTPTPPIDWNKDYKIMQSSVDARTGKVRVLVAPSKPVEGVDSEGYKADVMSKPRWITWSVDYNKEDPEFWLSLYNEAKNRGKSNYNKNVGGGLQDDFIGLGGGSVDDDDFLNMN